MSFEDFKCVCAAYTVTFKLDFTGVSFKLQYLQLPLVQEIPIHILKNGDVVSHRQMKFSLQYECPLESPWTGQGRITISRITISQYNRQEKVFQLQTKE